MLPEVEHAGPPVVVDFTRLDARAVQVVREDGLAVVPQRPRDQEDVAAVDAVGHPRRFPERGRRVVHRGVRRVHPGELADQALVLPERLKEALAQLGLVRCVRRVEFGPRRDRSDARGDEVVVQTAAEERRHLGHRTVRGQERGHVPNDGQFRQAVREVDLRDADGGGDVGEEVVDALQAHRSEHLVLVGGHAGSAERGAPLKGLASTLGSLNRRIGPREFPDEPQAGARFDDRRGPEPD